MNETPSSFYLAGPMTGIPKFNFPLFDAVAYELREQGYTVHSPAEMDDPATREAALRSPDGAPGSGTANGETYGTFLSRDIKIVLDDADAVCVLPNWQGSSGACMEVHAARRRGKAVFAWDPVVRRAIPIDYVVLAQRLAKSLFLDAAEDIRTAAEHAPLARSAPIDPDEYKQQVAAAEEEIRVTSETGGQKGQKPVRLDLVPPESLWELARVYAMGAEKYDDHNYLKGYDWSLSYAAGLRHYTQWFNGEDNDPESGLSHLAHAAWHCFALMMFQKHALGTDDRIAGIVADGERIQATGRSEEARR